MLLATAVWELCLLCLVAAKPPRPRATVLTGSSNGKSSTPMATSQAPAISSPVSYVTGPLCAYDDTSSDSDTLAAVTSISCVGCTEVSGILIATSAPTDLTSLDVMNSADSAQKTPTLNMRVGQVPRDPEPPEAPGLLPRGLKSLPRTPGPLPLVTPNDIGQSLPGRPSRRQQQVAFMNALEEEVNRAPQLYDIGIRAPQEQLTAWQVGGVQVSATGLWYSFGDQPGTWMMRGLSGCTATLIVSPSGFWAGHLWEGSMYAIPGAAAFNERTGPDPDDNVQRPDNVFQAIAVNILTQPTPQVPASLGSFISLTDLSTQHGNPFGNGRDVDVFVFTKATSNKDKSQMYANKITLLQNGYTAAIPGSKYQAITYIGNKKLITDPLLLAVSGKIVVQYTPYEGTGPGCARYAAVKVWAEDNYNPVIEKTWTPLPSQEIAEQKRDSCLLSSSAFATNSTADSSTGPASTSTIPSDTVSTTASTNSITTSTSALITSTSSTTTSDAPQSQFTQAQGNNGGTVVSSISQAQGNNGGVAISSTPSAGPTATMKTGSAEAANPISSKSPLGPTATMEIGSSQVNVGTSLTGEALMSTISSALESLCPPPTSGSYVSCATDTVVLGPAEWLKEDDELEGGDLVLQVLDAQYNDTNFRDLLINMIARGANASASGANCQLFHWVDHSPAGGDECGEACRNGDGTVDAGTDTWCNMAHFFDTQVLGPVLGDVGEQIDMYLSAVFDFELGSLGDFSCDGILGTVNEAITPLFTALFPEFLWVKELGIELGNLGCAAHEAAGPGSKRATGWEEERKKMRLAQRERRRALAGNA